MEPLYCKDCGEKLKFDVSEDYDEQTGKKITTHSTTLKICKNNYCGTRYIKSTVGKWYKW